MRSGKSNSAAIGALPLAVELHPAPNPVEAFLRLRHLPHCLFLDSALRRAELGRYSFVAADPFQMTAWKGDRLPDGEADGWSAIESGLSRYSSETREGLPPFQGGVAGLFSYDLNRGLETIPAPRHDEFQCPILACGWYDTVVAFDHQSHRAWIISQGFPETEAAARRERAAARIGRFTELLQAATHSAAPHRGAVDGSASPILPAELAMQYPLESLGSVTSNFSAAAYRRAVRRAVDYIYAGDVFQVNLAQRLLHPATDDSVSLYLRLRERNPATFAAFFDLGAFQIISASPERFVRVHRGHVEARPIKGTRQRTARPEADLYAAADLLLSEKDRAENVMIVDLLRNDLSRVCEADSVQVTQLCQVEAYEYVQHLVSVVVGRLRADQKPLDLIRASFPGGSITGAPKVRAMEIIAELEPTARGPYCGSLGYLGFDGSMDLNILIRTITSGRGWWQLPVGGGIIAQSSADSEYEETWHKARGLLRALQ